jgi:hydroxymethylglutaryl-CoA synthase
MKLTNNTFSEIGIDSIGFYMPHLMLSHSTLAKSQNIDVNKYNLGLLTYEMRVPNLGEDIVVLGIKAAKNAIMNDPIDSSFIDAVFVGSETITYAVKSISNILKDILGLKHNCLTQDVYNACASGTLALLNSIALIESGVIERALIVAVDISTYPVGSSGESTQGAGAIAMIISKNPRIAVFGKQFGRVSGNINDFFRNAGEFTPEVFGKYSLDSYISMQMEAYNDLIKRMHLSHPIVDHYIFHAPYAKLPLKFMQKLLATQFLQSNEFRKFFLSLDSNLNIENELNPAFDYYENSTRIQL